MHYLERLLQRAQALPRESGAGVFDPFEQVAPWDALPIEKAEAARAVEPPAPMERERAIPSASPVPREAAAAPPNPLHGIHDSHVSAVPPLDAPRLQPEAPKDPVAPPKPPTRAVIDDAAPVLARADAFMRALGVPLAPADAARVAAPAVHDPVAASPVRATHAPPREDAPSRVAARPPLLQPPSPSPVPLRPVPGPPSARAKASPPAPPPPAAAPSRRAAIVPAPERIVQTTVVLAPSARRLDELAHSSAITRFGIGQS